MVTVIVVSFLAFIALIALVLASYSATLLGLFLRRGEYWCLLKAKDIVAPFLISVGIIMLVCLLISWGYTPGVANVTGFGSAYNNDHIKTLWDWLSILSVSIGGAVIVSLYTEGQKFLNREKRRYESLNSFRQEMTTFRVVHQLSGVSSDALKSQASELVILTLAQLDRKGKEAIFAFLCRSGLIKVDNVAIDLSGADFSWIDVKKYFKSLEKLSLLGANFTGANMEELRIVNCEVCETIFRYTNVYKTAFVGTSKIDLDLSSDQLKYIIP